ncbi:helix-turn-helix domain-containing protein [Kitasatospora sp. NPDC017646]|uniref:helix-turn-helix domain-containing protein n=1 Tax=Kitasatospora sp. NPDC017646 TaxID=3364024 RepID=UPI0037B61E6B
MARPGSRPGSHPRRRSPGVRRPHQSVQYVHLSRLFLDQLGRTPAQFVRTARAEAAAQLLASTALPMASVARRCGFSSAETMRQVFLDHYGTTPSHHRTVHSTLQVAPTAPSLPSADQRCRHSRGR